MKSLLSSLVLSFLAMPVAAQSNYYDVTANDGYGLRFWYNSGSAYKIHMGNGSEYHYGPVTDYSIKTNMNNTSGRGWTWGIDGNTPVAAINNAGNMQLANMFCLGPVYYSGTAGTMSLSGTGAELSIVNRAVSGYVAIPSQGERWSIYNDGTSTNGVLRFWSGGDKMAITKDGNVGVGTSSPSYRLQVSGGAMALDADQPLRGGGNWLISGNSSQVVVGSSMPVSLRFDAGAVNRMFIEPISGNIGIGTTNPDQRLTVNGTVHATRVKVEATVPGPDYVFEKDYSLPSLDQIKSYIDENKHLPEVPSAKEMAIQGIDVGEMNMLLLKKVEELTLYVIQAKESEAAMRNEINELRKIITQKK